MNNGREQVDRNESNRGMFSEKITHGIFPLKRHSSDHFLLTAYYSRITINDSQFTIHDSPFPHSVF